MTQTLTIETGTANPTWATVDEIAHGFVPPDPKDLESRTKVITEFVTTLLVEGLILPREMPSDTQPWSPRGASHRPPMLRTRPDAAN